MRISSDIWIEIWGGITRNKMRTFLTGFSVAWGILMLIILLGSGNGLMNGFQSNFSDRATNSMRVGGGTTRIAFEGFQSGRDIELNNKDLRLTETEFPDQILKSGALLQGISGNLSVGSEYVAVNVNGVSPSFKEVEGAEILEGNGRFINELDILEERKVIVIHPKTKATLFKTSTALGKFVTLNELSYKVIGVYKEDKMRNDQRAFIPFTTAQKIYMKGDKVGELMFTTKNMDTKEKNEAFEKAYRTKIAQNQHFSPDDTNAIWIWNRFSQYLEFMQVNGILTLAIWVIGLFTLLSGIVGVSNIMLITVKERTKEFGIRKALGASPLSILTLVILESIAITTLFGFIGMLIGLGITEYANLYFEAQAAADASGDFHFSIFKNPTVSTQIALQAMAVLIVAGTLAGFFPAKKAVSIKPIEALRAD